MSTSDPSRDPAEPDEPRDPSQAGQSREEGDDSALLPDADAGPTEGETMSRDQDTRGPSDDGT